MPSVTHAIGRSLERMQRILFRPFAAAKWFTLGFSAFLYGLGQGGSFGNPGSWRDSGEIPGEVSEWIQAHLGLVLAIGCGILLAALALAILCAWLSSRGAFMFLDNVIHDRAEVREPWNRFRVQGNRLFVFSLAAGFLCLLLVAALAGAAALVLVPMLREGWNWAALAPILVFGVLLLLLLLAMTLFWAVLRDFGVPIMYRLDLSPLEALQHFRHELLPGHGWDFARFYLMQILLGMASAVLVLLAGCLTCCIGFLPYLSSVLTLPVTVFLRCYPLDFLAEIDPSWDLFPKDGDQAPELA